MVSVIFCLEPLMSLFDALVDFFAQTPDDDATPDGVCPNCWGRQQYNGTFREAARDRQIDRENGRDQKAFIRAFVEKHIDGITPADEGGACPKCDGL